MLSKERARARKVLLLPLPASRGAPAVDEVVSLIAVGQNRQRLRPLAKHIELKRLITNQRSEERFIVKDRLFRNREEFAALFCIRGGLLRIESVQSHEAQFLREDSAHEFQTVPIIDRQIKLRKRVEGLSGRFVTRGCQTWYTSARKAIFK